MVNSQRKRPKNKQQKEGLGVEAVQDMQAARITMFNE